MPFRQSVSLGLLAACLAAPAQAQLQVRDFNSDGVTDAYYDPGLNLTWLADFNYARTSGYDEDGMMNLAEARTWANGLEYFGVTGWRLPNVTPVNGVSFNYAISQNGSTDYGTAQTGAGWGSASELGHLFYVVLGNTGVPHPAYGDPTFPGALTNAGPFLNLNNNVWWSGADFGGYDIASWGWDFDMWDGSQDEGNPMNRIGAVAVHLGDISSVTAVPEPSTYAMMLLGLIALTAMRRRLAAKAR